LKGAFMNDRPSWNEYFMSQVKAISNRATCSRGRCACIAVRDKRIIATGYAGSPAGLDHCDEAGHDIRISITAEGVESLHCTRTVHAEQNVIIQAARFGQSLEGATLYCTMEPCRTCAMMVAGVGVVEVIADYRYQAAEESRSILKGAGIELAVLNDVVMSYEQ
jgi:dCMP deaminase